MMIAWAIIAFCFAATLVICFLEYRLEMRELAKARGVLDDRRAGLKDIKRALEEEHAERSAHTTHYFAAIRSGLHIDDMSAAQRVYDGLPAWVRDGKSKGSA